MVVSEANRQKLVLALKEKAPSKIVDGAVLMCLTKVILYQL